MGKALKAIFLLFPSELASSQARVFPCPSSVPTSGISHICSFYTPQQIHLLLGGSLRRVPMPPAFLLFFSPERQLSVASGDLGFCSMDFPASVAFGPRQAPQ